jgi:dihydroorotate dehydrogenase electron transfer subunit
VRPAVTSARAAALDPAHARLICRLSFAARERGLELWADAAYRAVLRSACRPCPRLLDDSELDHRCSGLATQLESVGVLWLDRGRVVCRLQALSGGAPLSDFPGPDRVRCLAIVDRPADANAVRRRGWSAVLSRTLDRHLRHSPGAPPTLSSPLSRPARETTARVVAIEPRGSAYRLTLACGFVAEAARPGQFILLECVAPAERRAFAAALRRVGDDGRAGETPALRVDPKLPLLRRPFGLHRFSGLDYAPERLAEQPPFPSDLAAVIESGRGATFDILFKVVGRGTSRLAQMRPGERLALRGPLGRPVEIGPGFDTAVLVAGGIGVGPLFALAQELRRQGRRIVAVLGAENRQSAPLMPRDFEDIGARAALVTEQEDGLLVTQYLERNLSRLADGVTEVFACGPVGMLREVARIAPPGLTVQVLMEQRMACGMGVCRGCVVRMRAEGGAPIYRTVCREGPAFRAEEVAWEEIAATAG